MSLYDELAKIGKQVKSQLPQMKNNETATVHVSVLPFIRALGYNTQDLSEVYPEYSILNMDAVDYAVLRDGEPIIFLEAKKAGENLSAKHWKQLFEYFNADKARVGILTNGVEFRFYTDSVKQNIMDEEPFLTIDVLKLDALRINVLEGFSKSRFAPEQTLREIKISNLVEKEFIQPSDDFVKHFAKQVHSGAIWQTVIQEFRPLVKRAWDDMVDQEIARRLRRHDELEKESPELLTEKKSESSTPTPLAGVPEDVFEIPVVSEYKGKRFEATLLVDDIMNWHRKPVQIRFENEIMSFVDAMMQAIHSINPDRKTGRTGLRFWRFAHPVTNEDLPIKDLCDDVQQGGPMRQQLLDQAKR